MLFVARYGTSRANFPRSYRQRMAQRCEDQNADCIVANVVPLNGHSVLPMLQKLNSEAEEEGPSGRSKHSPAGVPEADYSKECQHTEAQEMCDVVQQSEVYVPRANRLKRTKEQCASPAERGYAIG